MEHRIIAPFLKKFGKSNPYRPVSKVRDILRTSEAQLDDKVCAVQDITPLPQPQKVVLRVDFSSGRRVKLRIANRNGPCFEQSTKLVGAIGAACFPKAQLCMDGWTVFEWIEGETLENHDANSDVVDKAARLLAAFHAVNCPPNTATPEAILKDVRSNLHQKLPVLVAYKVISASQSQQVVHLGGALAIAASDIRLTHGDFSPANLVLRGDDLCSIDNEKVGFHIADYDACRAASFWDEWNMSGDRLLEEYSTQSGRVLTPQSQLFWSLFDLSYRISHRILSHGEFNDFCITKLRRLLSKKVLA
ncbi:aminoglycoside phosphotransferase family protein [Pseudophaeobacter leonis]|uniref:aminoglycoside phosphotransferase family protein n=1 Tax=Pseudophaeobacter leonis TaxID=1144477 RepID=UPI0009F6F789|nr:aminoglycoside phosphotransferase family protein [Pseudophaeobacter leonis]